VVHQLGRWHLPPRKGRVHELRTERWGLGSHSRPSQGRPLRVQCSLLLLDAGVRVQRNPGTVATVAANRYGKGDQGCYRWRGREAERAAG